MFLTQKQAQHIIDNFELLAYIAMQYLDYTNQKQCLQDLKIYAKFSNCSCYPNRGEMCKQTVRPDLSSYFPMWVKHKNVGGLGYEINYDKDRNQIYYIFDFALAKRCTLVKSVDKLTQNYCHLDGKPIEFPPETLVIDRREEPKVPYFATV